MAHVVPGAQAWSCEGGDVGVLLLHGLTGCPAALRPLAEQAAAAGHAVELPRLPGHGTHWRDLRRSTWRDWVREADAGLQRLRARTRVRVLVGLSFGGALALHLAAERPQDVDAAVLVNPWIHRLASLNALYQQLSVLQWVVPIFPGIGNDIAKPGQDELPYPWVALRAAASGLSFQRLVRRALPAVHTPLLVYTSRWDHTVAPSDSLEVLAGVSSADVRHEWLQRSFHVATLDYDAERITEGVLALARRVAS